MHDDVAAALADGFPDREVSAVDSAGLSWNETNETARVEFDDGEAAYLKVAVDGDPSGVATERAVLDYVGVTLPLPVPDVLAADPDAAVPYLATAPLAGRPLHEVRAEGSDAEDGGDPDETDLARRVGAALARVHAAPADDRTPPDAHGQVVGGGADGLVVDAEPWPDVLASTAELLHERGPSDRFDGYFEAVLSAIDDHRDALAAASAALLHGDPAGPNTFLTPGGIGFVDWEVAHVGDPAYELVRARDQQFGRPRGGAPTDLVTAFHDGYREAAGGLPAGFEERRPVYEAVWYLTRLAYFENYLELVDASEEAFADAVTAEMERRLDAVR